jgi:hypothetical protein
VFEVASEEPVVSFFKVEAINNVANIVKQNESIHIDRIASETSEIELNSNNNKREEYFSAIK